MTKNIDNILIDPQNFIPSLSEKEIKKLLADAIRAYFDKKITLSTLAQTAQSIKKYSSIPLNEIESDIEEIRSLTFVKEMLNDIAENLNNTNYA
jgi:hypothetical protein